MALNTTNNNCKFLHIHLGIRHEYHEPLFSEAYTNRVVAEMRLLTTNTTINPIWQAEYIFSPVPRIEDLQEKYYEK